MTCPSCGAENPDGFQFCGSCGASLSPGPTRSGEERKTVTVLFCDLVGFTAASESADPEDVRARLVPYHRMLRTEIEGYAGTVEKFIGDAVMAVFGAPVAHEDDAERAVRSALRILERITDLNASDASLGLQVRIGITTGEALVALDAHPEVGEGFVTGDVVNTASRLQGVAPVGGIVVGEGTHLLTRDEIDYEPLDAVRVKGKAEPVPIWRVLGARARFGTDLMEAPSTLFVGRERERALLETIFERALGDPSVQLLTIVGEPGVGKSRLVAELFGLIEERTDLIRWRQGRCLPYGEGITFWALGEVVKAHCGILESDPAEQAASGRDRSAESGWWSASTRPTCSRPSSWRSFVCSRTPIWTPARRSPGSCWASPPSLRRRTHRFHQLPAVRPNRPDDPDGRRAAADKA